MAFYMLNCSVDIADKEGDHISEDLCFNDQESIIELVLEIGLGFEDAVPEREDADGDQETSQKKNFSTDLMFLTNYAYRSLGLSTRRTADFLVGNQGWVKPGYFEMPSPPPDRS